MIRSHVDVVLAVRYGFSGRPLTQSALLCELDGRRYRPISKSDGYLVFADIGSGEHEIVLRGAHFREERVSVVCTGASSTELVITMKPASNYPFGRQVTWLTVELSSGGRPAPGARIWMAAVSPLSELKIAQEEVAEGETECRVFFKGQAGSLSLPGHFLLSDGENSEIALLESLEGETGIFSPFKKTHKRGRGLLPAQSYSADVEGKLRAVFSSPVEVAVFLPASGKLTSLKLSAGENNADIKL